jgi:hypothetical protein
LKDCLPLFNFKIYKLKEFHGVLGFWGHRSKGALQFLAFNFSIWLTVTMLEGELRFADSRVVECAEE